MAAAVAMVLSAVGLVWFVKGKTTIPAKTKDDLYPNAEWGKEDAGFAWLVTAIY